MNGAGIGTASRLFLVLRRVKMRPSSLRSGHVLAWRVQFFGQGLGQPRLDP